MEYNGLFFEEREFGEGLALTGCTPGTTRLHVPARVEGVPVVAIADEAFMNNTELIEVEFEEPDQEMWFELLTFAEIGESAFRGCTSLRRITVIGNDVSVRHGAFAGCRKLRTARLGSSVSLSGYAFYECAALDEISPLYYVGEGALEGCEALTHPIFDTCAHEIDEDGFRGSGVVEVNFPATLSQIGRDAFRSCTELRRATFAATDGWYWECAYVSGKRPLDVSDPVENAVALRTMDFDDGVLWWRREK